MNIKDLKKIIEEDSTMMDILCTIDRLNLQDAWLCAGAIRNLIWNYLSGKGNFDFTTDVDVIFYDERISYENTLKIQNNLCKKHTRFNWEVKNQIYMHSHNPNTQPYKSSCDAISKFPEICTAIGAKLNNNRTEVELFCPYGIDDIIQFKVCPTPYFQEDVKRMAAYRKRILQKDWADKWPQLTISMFE